MFDESCAELARNFLSDEPELFQSEDDVEFIAQAIQDAIESSMTMLRELRAGRPSLSASHENLTNEKWPKET